MMIKGGVRVSGVQPEIVLALVIANDVYESVGQPMLVTSLLDGEHMRGSLHYVGAAADSRNPTKYIDALVEKLAVALGENYDVVPEHDHIHVEFQPKVGA